MALCLFDGRAARLFRGRLCGRRLHVTVTSVRSVASLVLALAVLLARGAGAIAIGITAADAERALAIARDTEAARTAFHARYVFSPGDATADQIEAVTEFRRIVLTGEDRARFGDWMFLHSAGSALKAVERWRGLVTIVARLRFHPQNVLTSVPAYAIDVDGTGAPVDTRTMPTWSIPFRTPQGEGTALIGATIEADFDAAGLGNAPRAVRIVLDRKFVAGVTVDFGRLE